MLPASQEETTCSWKEVNFFIQSCQPYLADVHYVCNTALREEFIGTSTYTFPFKHPCHTLVFLFFCFRIFVFIFDVVLKWFYSELIVFQFYFCSILTQIF